MKLTLSIIVLLVVSVFAFSLVVAEEASDDVDVTEDASIEVSEGIITESEVSTSLAEAESVAATRGKVTRQGAVTIGNGWFEGDSGALVNILWVHALAESSSYKKIVSRGLISVDGRKYHLKYEGSDVDVVAVESAEDSSVAATGAAATQDISGRTVTFDLYREDTKAGTLQLTAERSVGTLHVWSGKLTIGDAQGSVSIATKTRRSGMDSKERTVPGSPKVSATEEVDASGTDTSKGTQMDSTNPSRAPVWKFWKWFSREQTN